MNVSIKVIPHSEQRYETCGDWQWKGDTLEITVSALGNWKYEMAVALHELIEVLLCKHSGITQKSADAFDIAYEKDRLRGKYTADQEPGDDPDAPYSLQHSFATGIERMFIFAVGASWGSYNSAITSL